MRATDGQTFIAITLLMYAVYMWLGGGRKLDWATIL